MKILITGANSYVGARIYFDLSKELDVVGTYHASKLSKSFIELYISRFLWILVLSQVVAIRTYYLISFNKIANIINKVSIYNSN